MLWGIFKYTGRLEDKVFYSEGMVTALPAVPIDLRQFQLYVSSSDRSLVAYLVPENKKKRSCPSVRRN